MSEHSMIGEENLAAMRRIADGCVGKDWQAVLADLDPEVEKLGYYSDQEQALEAAGLAG
jgi:hypothetical protein